MTIRGLGTEYIHIYLSTLRPSMKRFLRMDQDLISDKCNLERHILPKCEKHYQPYHDKSQRFGNDFAESIIGPGATFRAPSLHQQLNDSAWRSV